MTSLWFLLAVPIVAFVFTGLVRRHAVEAGVLDVPNERSSHTVPTPRGGGLAIVFVVLLTLPLFWLDEAIDLRALLALGISGFIVAVVGWWDDLSDLAAYWRLLVHLFAATLVLVLVGGVPPLPGLAIGSGVLATLASIVFIVWMLNLYNFMDGIDGIAGVEAVTVAGIAATLLWWEGESSWALLSAVFALASLGFLAWNWPPAKIFMGDAGSGFLGFFLAALAVLTSIETTVSLWSWFILLGVFIVDASLTLIRRALRRERVYKAHRSHAYQHAARVFGSHKSVTIAVLFINLLWLGPWAAAAILWPSLGGLFVAISWSPLVLLCLRFRAGLIE